ncbi:MAG: triose-phosphate isomerase [Clostridia bacterium]|jgi:triosephosphate isomerase|nr:triose-phosphate isomerase [Clostridia bacterium]
MSRKAFIAGNWKMNMTVASGTKLITELKPLVKEAKCDVCLCVPAILIPAMTKAAKGSKIKIGAENMHWAASGAYTGEISADMLKDYGVKYVIIGHSERRQYFGENNDTVNQRTLAALKNELTPIVCIGETLSERSAGDTEKVLSRQLEFGLHGVEDVKQLVIAYEPVWAIGTGQTATDEQAQETIKFIRKKLSKMFSVKDANRVRILYGGSMNAGNCKGLMAQPDIDGGLIGGASLKLDFAKIVNFDK